MSSLRLVIHDITTQEVISLLELIVRRLFSVKSIVTLVLTGVFSYLAISGKVDGKEFLTIFTVIISFYFGTQAQKNEDSIPSEQLKTKQDDPELKTPGWEEDGPSG